MLVTTKESYLKIPFKISHVKKPGKYLNSWAHDNVSKMFDGRCKVQVGARTAPNHDTHEPVACGLLVPLLLELEKFVVNKVKVGIVILVTYLGMC